MRKRVNMKSAFVGMPKSFYDVLTFRELKIGDKFIGLPAPGDNHRRGGFRNEHYVFRKLRKDYRDIIAHCFIDNAFRLVDGKLNNFSENEPVIKLED